MAGYGRRQTTSRGGGDWPSSELHARTDAGVMAGVGVGASDGALHGEETRMRERRKD